MADEYRREIIEEDLECSSSLESSHNTPSNRAPSLVFCKKKVKTHAIAGRMNASYIREALYKLIKRYNKLSQGSNVSSCLTPL